MKRQAAAVLTLAALGAGVWYVKTRRQPEQAAAVNTPSPINFIKGLISMTPRGIRNNNPLNIRKSADNWQGKTGDDGAFVIFDTPQNGIRAAGRLLKTYRDKYGLNTIRGIVNRWAPPKNDKGQFENDTESYITSVEKKTGLFRDLRLNAADYPAVLAAMIHHENGVQPYDLALITQAVADGFA